MNPLLLKRFTPQILRGAMRCSVSSQSGGLVTISAEMVEKMLKRAQPLSESEALLIERQTGKSIGELAVMGLESARDANQSDEDVDLIRDTIELMRAFDAPTSAAPSPRGTTSVVK